MKPINNYDTVQATSGDFARPAPGGYVCEIVRAEDFPFREETGKGDYLKIEFDFIEGELKGYYEDTYKKFNYWGGKFVRSYKEKALGMFKHFTNCVEESNEGYAWDWNEHGLVGKKIGVVLGEEEYIANDGGIKTRLEVKAIKTVDEIRKGDFKVPPLKKLKAETSGTVPAVVDETDDDLPF